MLALAVLKGRVSHRHQLLFAQVMPILRKELEGITMPKLQEQLGLPVHNTQDDLYLFLDRLAVEGVACFGKAGSKRRQLYGFAGVVRLSANYWLKETAMRQRSASFYTAGYSIA